LLPNFLSRDGPCIVVADVNADNRDDIFIGGAKGRPGQLFLQNHDGTFIKHPVADLVNDTASEDVTAVFFDADGDHDPDLYVGSGGYEFSENDPALQDRLYLNDGKGNFVKNKNALPSMISSTGGVRFADIDNDGDLDLFAGGRVVPGKYPVSPRSYILKNDGKGYFTDITGTVAPDLAYSGMTTDAFFTDLNNDKRVDLIIVGEWMPVKIFINSKSGFVDESARYIKTTGSGWWNRIYAGDMDNDGDIDLIVGNCGLNTQFHCAEKEPMSVYYKDFDQNGSVDPVVCYYIGGTNHPAASKDDLIAQLPYLKNKFLSYSSYAKAGIHDLFTAAELKDAGFLQATTMETMYLENKNGNEFIIHRLPKEAQYAPVYGIASLDINHDGKKDLLLLGDNTWTRVKFGRYSANHGVALAGDGKGGFSYIPQYVSGLNIRGNVRSVQSLKIKGQEKLIVGMNDAEAIILSLQ